MRQLSDRHIAAYNKEALRRQQVQSHVTQRENGTYTVTLKLRDDVDSLMELELMVADKESGQALAERFQREPEKVYAEVIALLSRYNILSERELRARHDIYLNGYRKSVLIEAECALGMVSTLIVPAGLAFADSLRTAADTPPVQRLRDRVNQLNDRLLIAAEQLEATIAACAPEAALKIMTEARQAADELEGLVPAATWPLPSYAEMLLLV